MRHVPPILVGSLLASAAVPAVASPAGTDFDAAVFALPVVQIISDTDVPLIAGRSTMVRGVVFSSGTIPPGVEMDAIMRVYVDGVEAADSPVYSVNGPKAPQATISNNILDDTFNFVYIPPESDDVVFEVEINPAGPGQLAEATYGNNVLSTAPLSFICRATPEVVYVPVDYQPGGNPNPGLPDANLIEPGVGDAFIQGIYPSSDWEYRIYDPGTKLWTASVAGTGSGLNSQMASELALMSPQPDFIYSWINGGLGYNGQALGIPGVAAMGNTEPIRFQRTFAHELGHLFGESHLTIATGTTGVDVEHQLEETQNLPQLQPGTKRDIMQAGLFTEEAWIWPGNFVDYNNDPQFACSQGLVATANESLLIGGLWNTETGEFEITDSLVFPGGIATATAPTEQGDLIVRVVRADGSQTQTSFVANISEDCAADSESGDSEGRVDPIAGFSYVLQEDPANIDRLSFVEARTGKTLASLERSASAPTLELISPRPFELLAAEGFFLEWEAQDGDGDELTYYVRYSFDGDTVFPIGMGLTENRLWVDPTQLPKLSSGTGWFEILATDGLNSATVRTQGVVGTTFALGSSQPPTTYVLTPNEGKSYPFGATVILHSSGWDLEDRALTGGDVVWSSDLDGPIATGRVTSAADLSVGTHVITVQVSDSDNQTASDTATITITPRDLPGAEEVCQADLGFGGPGNSVLTVCGQALSAGATSTIQLTNATPNAVSWLVYSAVNDPISIFGATLVPNPPILRMQMTDTNGEWSLDIDGGGGPTSLFVQVATVDPSQAQGFEFSNAVEILFMP